MDTFDKELLLVRPGLRAFARNLTKDPEAAEDLVQDTLVRAIRARERFTLGTSMRAWTFQIMRNQFLSDCRSNRNRPVLSLDDPDHAESGPSIDANQLDSIALKQTLAAMEMLSPTHRDALRVIRIEGHSYEEAGLLLGRPEGSLKSSVHRALKALNQILTRGRVTSWSDMDIESAFRPGPGRSEPAISP